MLNLFEQRVGQQLVQQQILWQRRRSWASSATDDDVMQVLHNGQSGEVLFPGGNSSAKTSTQL